MSTRSRWQQLATEAVNPRSRDIDTLTADEMIEVMILDNRTILTAVQDGFVTASKGLRPVEIVGTVLLIGSSLLLIVLILLHRGKGGGLSNMFGGGVTSSLGGSSVVERNLDRMTIGAAIVWTASIIALALELKS